MKIIIDTNIVFSAILNSNNSIGDILLNSEEHFEFYSVSYLKDEIENHKTKLSGISGLTIEEIDKVKSHIYSNIIFVSDNLIPFEYWKQAIKYVKDVDMDDIAFVALSLYMDKAPIWTGDLKLAIGIRSKGFKEVLMTEEIGRLRDTIEKNKEK